MADVMTDVVIVVLVIVFMIGKNINVDSVEEDIVYMARKSSNVKYVLGFAPTGNVFICVVSVHHIQRNTIREVIGITKTDREPTN